MEQAVKAIVQTLDERQRKKALLEFDDNERKTWHFTIKVRKGLPLREMTAEQRSMVTDLLQLVLSEQGFQKAEAIMQLELVLQEIEKLPPGNDRRNPELYYLAVFGQPGSGEPWGWRFEGHHLSLNFSSVDQALAVTPAFFGSNPAIVRSGSKAGTQVLRQEQEMGRALVRMLTPEQQATAILSEPVPGEMITEVVQEVKPFAFSGLAVGQMTPAQKDHFLELLGVYLNNMDEKIARVQWQKLENRGIDSLHFAWIGDTAPGVPHYYRIHGPTILIEYDNVQNNANHIHTVWRDLTNDFGIDLLRKHYREGHQH